MKRHRSDHNMMPIVKALRQAGWKVQVTSQVGDGFPDLVAVRGYDLKLIEVKSEKGVPTSDQVKFQITDGWPVYVIRTIDEALEL